MTPYPSLSIVVPPHEIVHMFHLQFQRVCNCHARPPPSSWSFISAVPARTSIPRPPVDVDRCFEFSGYEVNLRHSFTTTSSTTSVTSTSQTATSGTSTVTSTTSSVTTTTVTAYPSVAFNELAGNTCDDTKTSSGLSSATIDECKLQCFIDSTCLSAVQRMKFESPPFQLLNLAG